MSEDTTQEKIQSAVIIESFRKDIGFIKDSIKNISDNMANFSLKSETIRMQQEILGLMSDYKKALADHYKDDKDNFEELRNRGEELSKQQTRTRNTVLMGMGGLGVLVVLLQIFIPIIAGHFWK